MFATVFLSFLYLSSLALTAVIPDIQQPRDVVDSTIYDAIVVGGGPAGLSALSGLARVRRNAILIDSGEYRNNATRHMHDVIGLDGMFQSLISVPNSEWQE